MSITSSNLLNAYIPLYYCACFTRLLSLTLSYTGVHGDICELKMIPSLRHIYLGGTQVQGTIAELTSLRMLQSIYLFRTRVNGNINCLQDLPHLTGMNLHNTNVIGDEEQFQRYRSQHKLKKCNLYT